jgi:hypothetical protein
MDEERQKERLKELIMSFHRLRIAGIISKKESISAFKRYSKIVYDCGFTFRDAGFYEYVFEKIETI